MKAAVDAPLIVATERGLYCPPGDFHIDPWRPVERALITHAHGDHASVGSVAYLAADEGLPLLRARLPDMTIETVRYGERRRIGTVDVSFHPAGHVLGSAQIRLEAAGRVWVVSGDYKLAADPTCSGFEPVRCEVFVSESTFGLPIYRWDPPEVVLEQIAQWWEGNRTAGDTSVLFAYALGKAQRILVGLVQRYGGALPGPVYCHGAVERINEAYRAAGVALPPTQRVAEAPAATRWSDALVVAPPSARGSRWMQRFAPHRTAFASGWMSIRNLRKRTTYDTGFALSDHADWDALGAAIAAADPAEVWVTHGYRDELVRWLVETGRPARAVETRFVGEAGPELLGRDDAAAA